MKSKTKFLTYAVLAMFLMVTSVFYANSSKQENSIQTSGKLELSDNKIEWGRKIK